MTQEQRDALVELVFAVSRIDTVCTETNACLPYDVTIAIMRAEVARQACWAFVNALTVNEPL